MKRLRWSRALAGLACVGMILPPTLAQGGDPVVPPDRVNAMLSIEDVALGNGQSFRGAVVDENGQPVAGKDVVVSQLGREVARTTTDETGRFAFRNLRGGLHLVRAGEGEGLYRFWTTGTAPPHSRESATLVDSNSVRGQQPFRNIFTSKAFILTAVVLGAVFIPIAVHEARNDKDSGS